VGKSKQPQMQFFKANLLTGVYFREKFLVKQVSISLAKTHEKL
jgi:hypothetical protein